MVNEVVGAASLAAIATILGIVLKDRRQFTKVLLDSCVNRMDTMDLTIRQQRVEMNVMATDIAKCEQRHIDAGRADLERSRKQQEVYLAAIQESHNASQAIVHNLNNCREARRFLTVENTLLRANIVPGSPEFSTKYKELMKEYEEHG